MAKKESQQLANPSTAKKPLKVAPPAKKPSEAGSSANRKPLEITSSAKKKPHLKIPPPESSDDEEDEKTEEEENETDSSSEEEEEEPKDSGKNPETPSTSAPLIITADAESESESESEGESDSEAERDLTKPPAPPAGSASPNSTKTKRPSEGATSKDVQAAKRAKTEDGTTDTAPKTALFQRIWSEEDEIVILQGMIDFKTDTGKSPNSENMNEFYETLKKPISFENKSYRQFTEKIASLKRKYVGKRKTKGGGFTNAHDQRCFELAKKIWGSDNHSGVVKTEKMMMKVEDESALKEGDWFKRSFLVRALMSLGWEDEALLIENWNILPTKTKKKIEEKWKLVRAKDNDCVLLKMDLVFEVVSVIAAQAD